MKWRVLVAIMIIAFIEPAALSARIRGRADFNYQQNTTSGGGVSDSSSSLNQDYTIGFDKVLTKTITVSGEMRYSILKNTNGEKTTDYFPMLFLNFNPPSLYNFSFGYNRTESAPSGERISSSSMNASFNLPAGAMFSPSLTYNRSTTRDHLTPHKVNTVSTNMGLNMSYGFDFLDSKTNLGYSFNRSVMEDKVGNIEMESPNHLLTAGIARTFWDEKIKTSANIGYNRSETINVSNGEPTRFEYFLVSDEGLFAVDTTPSTDFLVDTPDLIDNNTGASAGMDLNGFFRNIGLKFAIAQSVHKLHLYVDTSDPNISTYDFGWELYTSDDGINWTLVSINSTSFDSAFSRMVFEFDETSARYIKVVNTLFPSGALAINVTELDALGYVLATPKLKLKTVSTRKFGGFRFSIVPVKRMNLSYNIDYDNSFQDTNRSNSTNIGQNISMNFIVMPRYLTVSAAFATTNSSSSQDDGALNGERSSTDSTTNNYSVSFSSRPLKTLNGSINYGHAESIESGSLTSASNSLSGNLFMELYEGIDLGVGSSLSFSKSPQADSKTESVSYNGNLKLVPWKSVRLVTNGTISRSATEKEGEKNLSHGSSLNTRISYTPTRRLYLSVSLAFEPSSAQSLSVTWLMTKKLQLSGRYGKSGNRTNIGANLSWAPLSWLDLYVNYSGMVTDNSTNDKSEAISLRASVTF